MNSVNRKLKNIWKEPKEINQRTILEQHFQQKSHGIQDPIYHQTWLPKMSHWVPWLPQWTPVVINNLHRWGNIYSRNIWTQRRKPHSPDFSQQGHQLWRYLDWRIQILLQCHNELQQMSLYGMYRRKKCEWTGSCYNNQFNVLVDLESRYWRMTKGHSKHGKDIKFPWKFW